MKNQKETSDQIDKSVGLFHCAGKLLKKYPHPLSFKWHSKLRVL